MELTCRVVCGSTVDETARWVTQPAKNEGGGRTRSPERTFRWGARVLSPARALSSKSVPTWTSCTSAVSPELAFRWGCKWRPWRRSCCADAFRHRGGESEWAGNTTTRTIVHQGGVNGVAHEKTAARRAFQYPRNMNEWEGGRAHNDLNSRSRGLQEWRTRVQACHRQKLRT